MSRALSRTPRLALALAPAMAWTGLASMAFAQGVADHPIPPGADVWLEVSAVASAQPSDGDVSTTHFAPGVAGGVRLAEPWTLTVDATYAITSYQVAGRERVAVGRFGNPFLATHLLVVEQDRHSLRFGLGTAAPLVTVPGTLPENAAADFGDRVAFAARGAESPWLWTDNAIPVVLVASAAASVGERMRIGLDLQPAYVASVNRRDSRMALDAAASLGVRVQSFVPEIRLHAYAQSVPIEDGDFVQTSATLGLRYQPGPWWLRGGATLNLDGPFGVDHRATTHLGVTLALGAAL